MNSSQQFGQVQPYQTDYHSNIKNPSKYSDTYNSDIKKKSTVQKFIPYPICFTYVNKITQWWPP
jgi:hypothetical protein